MEAMTLERATEFMRLVDNGQISGRISEWPGLRQACGVVYAHLAQPAQAVDVEKVVADLVDAGRILERYEDPRMKPLSEESFRIYDGVRQVIHARKLTLTRALGCNGFQWLEEVIEEMRRDARAFPISSFQRVRLEATADKLTRAHQGQNSIALSRGNASLFGKAHDQA